MNSHSPPSARDIFNDALALQPSERAAFLAQACGGHSDLKAMLEAMLAAHADVERVRFLESPPLPGLSRPGSDDSAVKDLIGSRLAGSYEVREVLGRGGMAVVYLAEQEHPHRTVALKLMRADYLSSHSLRRFELEAELLGRFQHPGIAQIFEAGTAHTPLGAQPFFAIEYVADAKPITRYAEDAGLSLRQRLDLFCRVCDAVHYGHQRGVIHRDLKPGNILVNESGQPKVIDFGVARTTDADVAITTMQTDVGQIIGTLQYMSPEQTEGDSRNLDTRSDIYSLGLVCWELLVGDPPYDIGRCPLPEAIRVIRDHPPVRLSSIRRAFRGDLETILNKALEKSPERRYPSVSAFAADIRRYLNSEPIVARPPSTVYQLRKFAGRNRALVAGAASVVVVLVLGIITTSLQAHTARQERDLRTKVSEFQTDVFVELEPADFGRQLLDELLDVMREDAAAGTVAPADIGEIQRILGDLEIADFGRRTLTDAVLGRATETVGVTFADQPLVEAALRLHLGMAMFRWADYAAASEQLTQSLALFQKHDPHNPVVIACMQQLAVARARQGESSDELVQLFEEVIESQASAQGDQQEASLFWTMGELINLHTRRGADADVRRWNDRIAGILRREQELTEAQKAFLKQIESRSAEIDGRPALAARLRRESIETYEKVIAADPGMTPRLGGHLAHLLLADGKPDQAVPILELMLEARQSEFGRGHPYTIEIELALGRALYASEREDEYERLAIPLVAICSSRLGYAHDYTINALSGLAGAYWYQERYEEAAELNQRAYEACRRELGPDHHHTLMFMQDLVSNYVILGWCEEAEPLCVEAIHLMETSETLAPDQHWRRAVFLSNHGRCLTWSGEYEQAEAMLIEAYTILRDERGPEDPGTIDAAAKLVSLYADYWQRPEEAERWRPAVTGQDVPPPVSD